MRTSLCRLNLVRGPDENSYSVAEAAETKLVGALVTAAKTVNLLDLVGRSLKMRLFVNV